MSDKKESGLLFQCADKRSQMAAARQTDTPKLSLHGEPILGADAANVKVMVWNFKTIVKKYQCCSKTHVM